MEVPRRARELALYMVTCGVDPCSRPLRMRDETWCQALSCPKRSVDRKSHGECCEKHAVTVHYYIQSEVTFASALKQMLYMREGWMMNELGSGDQRQSTRLGSQLPGLRVMLVWRREAGRVDVRAALERDRSIRIVSDTADIAEARAIAEQTRPDVLLIDAQAAGSGLVPLVTDLRASSRSRIVVIGSQRELGAGGRSYETLLELRGLRVPGYLVWEELTAEDVPAIVEALRSESVVVGTWAVLETILAPERRSRSRTEGVILSEEERALLREGDGGRIIRGTLWAESSDVTALLRVAFELAGIGFRPVKSAEDLLTAAAAAEAGDFVLIDCSRAMPEDIARCMRVVTQVAVPTYIIHPNPAIVDELRSDALGSVFAIEPRLVGLPLLQTLRRLKVSPSARRKDGGQPALTERELTVLRLMAAGRTQEQIGEAIERAPRTVRQILGRIETKTGQRGHDALIRYYRRAREPE